MAKDANKPEGNRQAPLNDEQLYNIILDNVSGIDSKFNTQEQFFKDNSSPYNYVTSTRQNIFTIMESQFAPFSTNYLPNDGVQSLTDIIYNTHDGVIKLISLKHEKEKEAEKAVEKEKGNEIEQAEEREKAREREKEKYSLGNAKSEAALKGFAIDLSEAQVEQMREQKRAGLSEYEVMGIKEPLEKAMLELANQKIPKEQYREKLINKTLDNLKEKVSETKLSNYREFLTKNTTPKLDGQERITDSKQIEALTQEAAKMVEFFKNKLQTNEKEAKALSFINELGVNEPNIIKTLLLAISKLPSEKMTEQGREIIKNFAPLLESNNPVLVNGTKKVLSELEPGYLTEHGKGEGIALELQRVAKPKLWQRIVGAITGTDYAQKNIDKAFANFEKSNSLYITTKNLPEKLKKEAQARAMQEQDKEKGVNVEKKEQGKEQNKTIPQSYKSSISPPISHVENLNKNRESKQQSGHSK